MAVIQIPDGHSFDLWRQKTNLIGEAVGDLTLLETTVQTDLVSAINEVLSSSTSQDREILVRAIAMS